MTKVFEEAIEEVTNLPDADQEQIGHDLLVHVEKLRHLRTDLDRGIKSLEAGEGKSVDIEDVIRRSRDRYEQP
jgi:hypothetical protein